MAIKCIQSPSVEQDWKSLSCGGQCEDTGLLGWLLPSSGDFNCCTWTEQVVRWLLSPQGYLERLKE